MIQKGEVAMLPPGPPPASPRGGFLMERLRPPILFVLSSPPAEPGFTPPDAPSGDLSTPVVRSTTNPLPTRFLYVLPPSLMCRPVSSFVTRPTARRGESPPSVGVRLNGSVTAEPRDQLAALLPCPPRGLPNAPSAAALHARAPLLNVHVCHQLTNVACNTTRGGDFPTIAHSRLSLSSAVHSCECC
jgi:hypothetical protein